MAQPLQLLHDVDPAQEIIGDSAELLASFQIRPYDVLLVMYQRELITGDKRLRSGIFLSDNGVGTLREDAYQGKVGLVMKVGSLAFTDEADHKWEGFAPKVGDWVVINVGDTFGFELPKVLGKNSGRKVRIVDENLVRAIVPEPDVVW
jgi:hypothetical protein